MNEFISWTTLGTYSGALIMVCLLTQFTKGLPITERIPTQLWSYILALAVLLCATGFTSGFTASVIFQTLFNAVVVSMAANGGFSAVKKITDAGKHSEDLSE